MKTVPLHGKHGLGRVALVDDEDYDRVAQYHWNVKVSRDGVCYAVRTWTESGRSRSQFMHQLITGYARTDHANHDGLDNQRSNLRDGTGGRNSWNTRKLTPATSRYKGVKWDETKQKWAVAIAAEGRQHFIGRFTSEVRAALAHDRAARQHHGEYAYLNFPDLPDDTPDLEPPEVDRSNAAKTHCKRDHEFTPENTRLIPGRGGRMRRVCLTCQRDGDREAWRARHGSKPRGDGNGYVAAKARRTA